MVTRAEATQETHRRILDAAWRLFSAEWYDDVTLAAIADTAGVSHQTVLNHFGSKEEVFAALDKVVEAEIKEGEVRHAPQDVSSAVRSLLSRYEHMGLANARFVLQEHRVPALHAVLERARANHRAWVETTFADFLPPSGVRRRQKIAALLAATEVMAWKSIRHDYGFSKTETAAAITALVHAAKEGP